MKVYYDAIEDNLFLIWYNDFGDLCIQEFTEDRHCEIPFGVLSNEPHIVYIGDL